MFLALSVFRVTGTLATLLVDSFVPTSLYLPTSASQVGAIYASGGNVWGHFGCPSGEGVWRGGY
jgi:hypothetical protein